MLREMADLGFRAAELSHGIRISLVPGILSAVRSGVIEISSVHNFCPLPPGINYAAPNLYIPSRPDGRETRQWLRHTRRTLDFAEQIGASRVVLHLGKIDFFFFRPGRKLRRYLARVEQKTPRSHAGFQKLLAKVMGRIRRRHDRHRSQVLANLAELVPYAAAKGLKLGLENREKVDELPLDEDFTAFFEEAGHPETLGYWHDTGHAELKQQLGLIDHREHLAGLADRLVGFHLHDVKESLDHQPPGSGSIDFEAVLSHVQPDHALVLELSPQLSPEEVAASRDYLEKRLTPVFS
ncbi:MAG: sugar phosphate isomerase/epimerase [Puniceicoccaceae bacterium]|nr:MAG: sugar phosphate isomerase/epimerase [Puniceicoccaceae bacterium]